MPTFADLQTAIREKNAARVREILAAAPDLAGRRPPAGPSALLLAAYMGGGEIAEALRSRVAIDACEATALGALEELKKLLDEHPARTNARSGDGWTPLHLAGFFGRRDVAEVLLKRGASLTAISGGAEKNQPLHAALAGACDPVIVRALVAHAATRSWCGSSSSPAPGPTPAWTTARRRPTSPATAGIPRSPSSWRNSSPRRRGAEAARPEEDAELLSRPP
jgi:hypothetical protein